jgi:hypothetical protein
MVGEMQSEIIKLHIYFIDYNDLVYLDEEYNFDETICVEFAIILLQLNIDRYFKEEKTHLTIKRSSNPKGEKFRLLSQ